jgi:hypothetical protein
MKVTTIFLLNVCVVFSGCIGGPEDDICTRAAMHLESCTGSSGSLLDSCSVDKAQRILNVDCSTLQNGTRQSSFNLFDWLGNLGNNNNEPHHGHCDPFDPHCNGGEPHHGEPNHGWENGKKCYCDNLTQMFNDCCHHCQHLCHHGGYNPHDPSGGGYFGGGLEEPGGGNWGNQQGGWCSHQGGHNWRRCRQCGWQFCLPSGQWAPCQRPENNQFKHACGGKCSYNGTCY